MHRRIPMASTHSHATEPSQIYACETLCLDGRNLIFCIFGSYTKKARALIIQSKFLNWVIQIGWGNKRKSYWPDLNRECTDFKRSRLSPYSKWSDRFSPWCFVCKVTPLLLSLANSRLRIGFHHCSHASANSSSSFQTCTYFFDS